MFCGVRECRAGRICEAFAEKVGEGQKILKLLLPFRVYRFRDEKEVSHD